MGFVAQIGDGVQSRNPACVISEGMSCWAPTKYKTKPTFPKKLTDLTSSECVFVLCFGVLNCVGGSAIARLAQ